MKVYKKDVYDFLDKVEAKAVKSVEKKYDKKILESKTERTKDYLKEMREFGCELEQIMAKAQELHGKYNYLHDNSNWSNLSYIFANLRDSLKYCNSINASSVSMNPSEKELILEKGQELNDVRKEYAKLMHYAKNNSAKDSYNLLKEIGFDVTSLEQREKTLITKADKSKLFVCGENK